MTVPTNPSTVNPNKPSCCLCGDAESPLERLDSGVIVCLFQSPCNRRRYEAWDRREPLDAEQLSRMTGRTL